MAARPTVLARLPSSTRTRRPELAVCSTTSSLGIALPDESGLNSSGAATQGAPAPQRSTAAAPLTPQEGLFGISGLTSPLALEHMAQQAAAACQAVLADAGALQPGLQLLMRLHDAELQVGLTSTENRSCVASSKHGAAGQL